MNEGTVKTVQYSVTNGVKALQIVVGNIANDDSGFPSELLRKNTTRNMSNDVANVEL